MNKKRFELAAINNERFQVEKKRDSSARRSNQIDNRIV